MDKVRTMITIGGIEVMVEVSNDKGIEFVDESGHIEYVRLDILANLIEEGKK